MHRHISGSLSAVGLLQQMAQVLCEDVALDPAVADHGHAGRAARGEGVLEPHQAGLVGRIVLDDHQLALTRRAGGLNDGVDGLCQHRVGRLARVLGLFHGLEQGGVYLFLRGVGMLDDADFAQYVAEEREILDAPPGPPRQRQQGHYDNEDKSYEDDEKRTSFFHFSGVTGVRVVKGILAGL